MSMDQPTLRQRKVTGRAVFFSLVAFFGIVAGVNAIMIRFAVTTFGGVETDSAYKVGLAFNQERAAVETQNALHWSVSAQLTQVISDKARLVVNVNDQSGVPVNSIQVEAKLAHPANVRRDSQLTMHELAPGMFEGESDARPGQWDLQIDVRRGDKHLFRSRSRVVLH